MALFIFGCRGPVKEPAVSGSFYPGERKALTTMVDGFLENAEIRPVDGELVALIAPHAGYMYSGAVAGYTYGHLRTRDVETVILIGPSHYKSFRGASVYAEGSFRTPLGLVPVDRKIASFLLNEKAGIAFDASAFEKEHSLEVQIPFLQRTLRRFKIVPILIGTPTRESFDYLTMKLTAIMKENRKAILVASTDLSHYHDYGTAVGMDTETVDAVERMSIEDVENNLKQGRGEMCGAYPVLYTMAVARSLGANNGVVYRYANSGDVTGDRGRVVGYAAIGLYKSQLSERERARLLSLARETVTAYVKEGTVIDEYEPVGMLKASGATFVTINKDGRLRGCIGNIFPVMPLYRSVIRNAVSACSRDARFPPVTEEELGSLDLEVSVLSPLEPVADVNEVEVGKHGLYIVHGERSGLLLPQVAVEFGWDRNTFLEQVSIKAGLPRGAWKEARLYRFTADVIR